METLQPEIGVKLNVPYGPAGVRNLLDFYVPLDAQPLPVVVCIHGGGFRGGNKDGWASRALYLAKLGYACVVINYRLAPENPHPAAVEDTQLAIRWVRAHSRELGIDPKRIGAIGNSAGGHLAAFAGLDESKGRDSGAYGEHSSLVQCVVDLFGPVDFPAMMSSASAPILEEYMAAPFADAREAYAAASPINYVRADAPPMLIIHGTEDDGSFMGSVPISVSRAFHMALLDAGAESTLVEIEGAGHGFGGEHLERMWDAVLPFFEKHLREK